MWKTPLTILAGSAVALTGFANLNPAEAGGRHHHPSHHYFYGHHHHHGGQILGYSLLGAGLGYLIYSAGKNSGERAYDRGYDEGRRDAYYRPGLPQVIVVPPAGAQSSAPGADGAFDFSQCRETRPYETTIYVAGEPQPAYGTACLTHDGQWVAGPMSFGR